MMTFARTIPSTSEAVRNLIDEAMDYLTLIRNNGRAMRVDEFNYRLALDESLENALRHGNRLDRERNITLLIEADDSRAFITVCDEGDGFRPGDVPDPASPENIFKPSGRGLHLLTRQFAVEWLDGGRCVRIEV